MVRRTYRLTEAVAAELDRLGYNNSQSINSLLIGGINKRKKDTLYIDVSKRLNANLNKLSEINNAIINLTDTINYILEEPSLEGEENGTK